jgi:hypothetical protein
MVRSLNATFRGDEPETTGERIRGESFARTIAYGLASRGWSLGELEDWRDAGFLIPLVHENARIEIVVTQYHGDDRRWILQIAPARYPGWIRRLFSSAAVATPAQIHNVAIDTHAILDDAKCSGFQWCWDDLANAEGCDCVPMPEVRE